jgi:hypothetical protein
MSSSISTILKTLWLSLVINLILIELIGFESYNRQFMLIGALNFVIGIFGPILFRKKEIEVEDGKN